MVLRRFLPQCSNILSWIFQGSTGYIPLRIPHGERDAFARHEEVEDARRWNHKYVGLNLEGRSRIRLTVDVEGKGGVVRNKSACIRDSRISVKSNDLQS